MEVARKWKVDAETVFSSSPVVPVLVIDNIDDAVPLSRALMAGGINVLEVTLRTANAIDVIKAIATELPDAMVGAGTVTNRQQLEAVTAAGAKFAISPGLTRELLDAGNDSEIALLPGISSISELMKGIEYGYTHFKFFPAEASGGVDALKSFGGPFPGITFCPTGGINQNNYNKYLSLPNVRCIGGSWVAPTNLVAEKRWDEITQLAREAVEGATR